MHMLRSACGPRAVASIGSLVALGTILLLALAAPGSPWAGSAWPNSECGALSTWLSRWTSTGAYSNTTLPLPAGAGGAAGAAPGGAAALAVQQLGLVTEDALRRVGWRGGVRFAALSALENVDAVLASPGPYHDAGAFLVIVKGASLPPRRGEGESFLSVDRADVNLTAALPHSALLAITKAAAVLEAALGRRLFPFRLRTAPLAPCASGSGPCAVWDVGSGTVVLDRGLVAAMAGAEGLHAVMAAFAGRLAEQLAGGTDRDGAAPDAAGGLAPLAALFAKASGAAAVLTVLAQAMPIWFCIACPTILGLLAPFVFNFGLTAAADALCQQMQLPTQECTDLWWGAFALAMVLSLGAAVPIVYLCRLPECVKHLTN